MKSSAIWTPDGTRIIFGVAEPDRNALNLHWMPIDGSSPMDRLATSGNIQNATDVSPDGRFLVFTDSSPETGRDIWLRSLEGDDAPRPFLNTQFDVVILSASGAKDSLSWLPIDAGTQAWGSV